jgi:hypothetical protein
MPSPGRMTHGQWANVSAAVMAAASLTLTNAANSAILFHRVLDDCGGLSTDGGWVDGGD